MLVIISFILIAFVALVTFMILHALIHEMTFGRNGVNVTYNVMTQFIMKMYQI